MVATQLMAATESTAVEVSHECSRSWCSLRRRREFPAPQRPLDPRLQADRRVAAATGYSRPGSVRTDLFRDADPVFAMPEYERHRCSAPNRPPRSIRAARGGTAHPCHLDGRGSAGVRRHHHRGAWASSSSATGSGPRKSSTALEAIAPVFAQVQARCAAEDQLRYLAEHDDLTGLHNRRALLAHLDERLDGRPRGPVSALFLDLDRLKAINDYLGHHAGDWFIRAFAERFSEETRDSRPDRPPRRRRVRGRPSRTDDAPTRPRRWRHRCRRCCASGSRSAANCSPAPSVSVSRWEFRAATRHRICCAVPTRRCSTPRTQAATRSPSSPKRCR